ncbi:MAG: hypothetical protein Q8S84_05975 [bacterium]|nr:hypothetical protein [bacterium]
MYIIVSQVPAIFVMFEVRLDGHCVVVLQLYQVFVAVILLQFNQ